MEGPRRRHRVRIDRPFHQPGRGREAHHPTQTIHVARGRSLASQVVDAPDLKLPSSSDAVANLLAFKSKPASPGPPPAEGLRSSLKAPSLPANVIAPPVVVTRDVTPDQSRRGLTLNSVVPPAPGVNVAVGLGLAVGVGVGLGVVVAASTNCDWLGIPLVKTVASA